MSSQVSSTPMQTASDESEVRALYQKLLDSWNRRSAAEFAALFDDDGNCIGFDGSQLDGREQIESELDKIFAHHETPPYIAKVREVRSLASEVVLLRGIAGMVPPGKRDLDPALNAVQSLVANKRNGNWRIALFQNTPAQFHGRPELVEQLTNEVRQLLP